MEAFPGGEVWDLAGAQQEEVTQPKSQDCAGEGGAGVQLLLTAGPAAGVQGRPGGRLEPVRLRRPQPAPETVSFRGLGPRRRHRVPSSCVRNMVIKSHLRAPGSVPRKEEEKG